MKLAALAGENRTITVAVPGSSSEETVEITYRPGAMNLEVAEKVQELAEAGSFSVATVESLRTVLVSWDIQEEDGTPLDVTADSIRRVPLPFLMQVFSAIHEDARPNPQTGEASEGTSPQVDKSDTLQDGTSSSEQHAILVSLPGN